MSSSGLIYAVIVGAWAAYLVPMWLRRQDELNEARPTERFSTAIRLLSGRAGMERRYAKGLQARSAEDGEPRNAPEGATDSVDVRAFAAPPTRKKNKKPDPTPDPKQSTRDRRDAAEARDGAEAEPRSRRRGRRSPRQGGTQQSTGAAPARKASARKASAQAAESPRRPTVKAAVDRAIPSQQRRSEQRRSPQSPARRAAAAEAAARARRSKVLARRRRTTMMLFVAFTLGAVVAGVRGLAFLWAPALPALLLSTYIVYLRAQERRRFTYTMDRRRAEAAAQRLREHGRGARRRPGSTAADGAGESPASATGSALSALTADRRALVEQTDHAEWVDQQRERRGGPGPGDSWDPVPVPLPTYVTAPVAPRATGGVDLGAPDVWSSARSSSAVPAARDAAGREAATRQETGTAGAQDDGGATAGSADSSAGAGADSGTGTGSGAGAGAEGESDGDEESGDSADGRCDARRAASARRSRERGRTPLFDQYEDGDRPRAVNE